MIDSGVAGSELMIEKAVIESGCHPSDIKAIFLTHAHPDHIGTASYFREKYGAAIYASEGERSWIEDIDLQFAQRPIPNFYVLAGRSAIVDHIVKDGDVIALSEYLDNPQTIKLSKPGKVGSKKYNSTIQTSPSLYSSLFQKHSYNVII